MDLPCDKSVVISTNISWSHSIGIRWIGNIWFRLLISWYMMIYFIFLAKAWPNITVHIFIEKKFVSKKTQRNLSYWVSDLHSVTCTVYVYMVYCVKYNFFLNLFLFFFLLFKICFGPSQVTLFNFYKVFKWKMVAFFSVLLPKLIWLSCLLKSMFNKHIFIYYYIFIIYSNRTGRHKKRW